MIRYYKGSIIGDYHVKMGSVCQDANYVQTREGKIVFAAVADGLGSAPYSDVGSRIASSVAVDYCKEHITALDDSQGVIKVLNNAFVHAYKAVIEEANRAGNDVYDYDTTLCLAAFDGSKLFYGQAGDSGMIALMTGGEYVQVTNQHRDSEGYVFPLSFGPDYWEFGEVTEPVSAIMLMTDGIWDEVCPSLLCDEKVKIYVALAQRLMDRDEDEDKAVEEFAESVYRYWEEYPKDLLYDDKTYVVVYNPQRRAYRLDEEYYAMPDWDELIKKQKEKLYPDKEADDAKTEEITPTEETCSPQEESDE